MYGILYYLHFQIESQSVVCEQSCQRTCDEQGIKYVRLNPEPETEVGPDETDNTKLLNMLWTTRKYMHKFADKLDELKEFYEHYVYDSD